MTLDEEIAHVKERTDIVELVREITNAGVLRVGATYIGRCPFHPGNVASLRVSTRGFYHCVSCKATGSAIDFVMNARDMKLHAALRFLSDRLTRGSAA